MRTESSGKPDAWKLARPVWGWGRGETPRPTPLAFNALYSQWDCQRREPRPDRESWRGFIDRILKLDREGHVAAMLQEHKRLVMALFDDEYVSAYFWQEPTAERGRKARRSAFNAQSWYVELRWTQILDEILARVYVMRCQLVHGAATYGGKLNRTSLKHCVTMMQRLLPALLLVWIDHGADENWGEMCYPPMTTVRGPVLAGSGNPKNPR